MLAGGPLGIMRACMDVVVPYVHERKQFGQADRRVPADAGQDRRHVHDDERRRAYVYAVARPATAARPPARTPPAAILLRPRRRPGWRLRRSRRSAATATSTSIPAGRLLRDAKLYEIGAGTSEIRRMLIGRELFNAKPPETMGCHQDRPRPPINDRGLPRSSNNRGRQRRRSPRTCAS